MSWKPVAVALLWSLFAASVSAGPAVGWCALRKNAVLEQSKLSELTRLFGQVLTTESNGDVYFVSICRPVPNTYHDPRKPAGVVKFTTDGHAIGLGRIDQTDVVVNENGLVLTYVGGDMDAYSTDTCRGRRWRTHMAFICDPSATNDVLTLIDDQPEVCQVWFEIKTAKTCVRQPNVPLNSLENDPNKQIVSIENGEKTDKREDNKANQIHSGDESFNNEIGKFSVSKNAPNNKIEESDWNKYYSRNTVSEYVPFVNKYHPNVINENKSKDMDNKDENLNKIFETRKKHSDNGNGVNSRYANAENTSIKNETDSFANEMKLNTTVNTENQTFNRDNNDFGTLEKHPDDGNKIFLSNDVSSKYETRSSGKENKSVNYENKNTAEGNPFNNENHYDGTNENALNTTNNVHRNGSRITNAESKPLSSKNDNVGKKNEPTNHEINANNSNAITAKDRSSDNEINDFETNTNTKNGNKDNSRNTAAEHKSSRNGNDNSVNETKSSNDKEDGSNTTTAESHYGPKNEDATNAQNADSRDKPSESENGSANKSVNGENGEDDNSNDHSTVTSDSSDVQKMNRSDAADNGKSSGNRSANKPTETGAAGKNTTSSNANKTDDSNRSTRGPTTKTGNENETTATAVVESSTNRRSNTTSDRTEIENPPSQTAANGSSTTVHDDSTTKSDSSDVEKMNRSDAADNGKSSGNRSANRPTETGAAGKNATSINANKTDDSNRSTRGPTTKTGNDDETTATAVVESSTNRRSNTTSDRTEIENPPSQTAANNSSTTVDDSSPSNKTKNVTPTTGRPVTESDSQVPSNTIDDMSNDAPTDVPSDSNGTRLSAATILRGLGLLSVFCAIGGTAVNRYYYKLTGTDQIPFKGTIQSVYSRVKAFVTKTFCCCVGGSAALDVTDEKSSLLQPKYVPGEERTSRKNEKHQTSSDDSGKRQKNEGNDDKNNTNGYGSVSNEKRSPTADKKYRKKRSKSKSARVDLSDSGLDNVISSKLLKAEDNLQGKSVRDVIREKTSTIMNTKIKPMIANIFGKTPKKFKNADREVKEENAETPSNEPSFVPKLMDEKSAKNDDDGVRVDEKTGTDITEFPIEIVEEREKQNLGANPNNGENEKSSSSFDVAKEQDDSENSKDKLINKLVDDLDSIRFELDAKPEKLFGANKSTDSGGTEAVNTDKRDTNKVAAVDDKPPSNMSNIAWAKNANDTTALQGIVKNGKKDETPNGSEDVKAKKQTVKFRFVGSGADEEDEHAQMRKEQPAEESDVPGRESVDDDDDDNGSIETVEEVAYVDAESGGDGEEIVEETTGAVTVSPSEKASSSATPGEETGDTVLASTSAGASVKKPFGFQLGIGKSGVNMSMGAKQLGIGRSGVKFGKHAEAEEGGRGAMTIKLDKSGLRLNRDKKNAPRTSGETDEFDDTDGPGTRDATSAHKKPKPNFTMFRRSVSQPIGSDVQEAEGDDGPAASGVVSKKPSRSSAGLLKFGRSRSRSTEVMETDDGLATDTDALSSFIDHERYASSYSVDDVPDSGAGRRGNAISRSASGGNMTASSSDYASVPSASSSSSSSFDRHGLLGDVVRPSAPIPKDGKDDGDRRPTKTVDNKSNIKSKLNKFKKHTLNR